MSRQLSYAARGKILAAALQVFRDKGYKEATVREISRVAGVAVGGLYPYFGSKEQLYVEALQEEMKQYNKRIGEFGNADPLIGIRRYIENHHEYMASRKEMVARHFKDYDLEFAKPVRNRFFAYQKEFLEAIIRKGAEQKIFPVADCGQAALFVLCVLKGSLFYDLAGMIDLSTSGESLCRLVLDFLKNEKAAEHVPRIPGETEGQGTPGNRR
jgi:AcrR family transcriptional regulator